MADTDREWGIKSVTFNSVTYSKTSGMPLDIDWDDSSNEISDRVADEEYASAVIIPEKDLVLSITFREMYISIVKGTKSDVVVVFVKNDNTLAAPQITTRTFADMRFLGQRAGLQKSIPGQNTLAWRYEGDGTGRMVE